LQSVSQLL